MKFREGKMSKSFIFFGWLILCFLISFQFVIGQVPVSSIYGDNNGDGQINLPDIIFLVNYIFKGGLAPNPRPIGDANADDNVNLGDIIYLVNYVFKNGPPPQQPEISSVVVALADSTMNKLDHVDSSTYYFSKSASDLLSLNPGNIILSGIGNGTLRKVQNVIETNDFIEIQTEKARIDEVILQRGFALDIDLKPDMLDSVTSLKGMTVQVLDGQFYVLFNDVGICIDSETQAEVKITGSTTFSPSLEFGIKFDNGIDTLGLQLSVVQTCSLNVNASQSIICYNREITVDSFIFKPIIRPLPVFPYVLVMVPKLEINLGVNISSQSSVSAGITGTATITGGLKYKNGSWSTLDTFDTSFGYNQPSLSAAVDVEGYALIPKLKLLFYDVVGPSADLKGYLRFHAEFLPNPLCTLYAGLAGEAGFETDILGLITAGYSTTLFQKEWPLLSCSSQTQINFAPKVDYATGGNPSSVIAADLNRDGYTDLVTGNYSSSNVSVLINNGDGAFATKVDYATGSGAYSVFAADLDFDGDIDLAVTNLNSHTVSVLKNNGDGTFADSVNYGTGGGPRSVFASDLDGDGDQDLAVVDSAGNTVSVLKNQGAGTFAARVDYQTGSAPRSVFAVDLDGDGDGDLAVANMISNSVSVLMNNGDATFAVKVDYVTGTLPRSVFASDLDGDGRPDLAVSNGISNTISVLKNNGDGTFGAKVDYGTGSDNLTLVASDLDADGYKDLAVTNYLSGSVSVLKNNRDGTFAPKVDYGTGDRPAGIFASDLDSDGDLDLAVANYVSNTVSVLMNISQ